MWANVAWAEAYLHTKWHLDPSAVWPQQTWAKNWGMGCAPFEEGGSVPI